VLACALAFAPLVGCAPVLDAQSDLITQARRGVALAATAQSQNAQTARQLAQVRRERLDEAFDADVRDQVELTADWVIEARAAYAAALDAYATQATAADASNRATRENFQAIDAALERLEWLTSIQRNFTIPEQPKEQP
jgi:hypothetical protein